MHVLVYIVKFKHMVLLGLQNIHSEKLAKICNENCFPFARVLRYVLSARIVTTPSVAIGLTIMAVNNYRVAPQEFVLTTNSPMNSLNYDSKVSSLVGVIALIPKAHLSMTSGPL